MNNFTVHVLYLLIDAFGKDQFTEEEFLKFLIDNIGIIDKRALRSCLGYLKRKNLLNETDENYKVTQLFYDFSNKELLEDDKYTSLLDILLAMAVQKKNLSDIEFCTLFAVVQDSGKLQLIKLRDELFNLKLVEFDANGKVKLSIDGLSFFWSRSSMICADHIKSPPKKLPRTSQTSGKCIVDQEFLTALMEPLGKHNLLPFLKGKCGNKTNVNSDETVTDDKDGGKEGNESKEEANGSKKEGDGGRGTEENSEEETA